MKFLKCLIVHKPSVFRACAENENNDKVYPLKIDGRSWVNANSIEKHKMTLFSNQRLSYNFQYHNYHKHTNRKINAMILFSAFFHTHLRHLVCGIVLLAISVSTSQAVSINPVPCKASTITSTETFEFPEIKEFFAKASANAAKVPWIKTFSVTIGTSVASTKGEKCCPGAQYPSTYHEIGGSVSGSATLEVLAPPPLATFGVVNISANTPAIEWLGIPPVEMFSLKGGWKLGLYATASGSLGVDLTGKISECGHCVTLAVAGKLTVGIGATASGKLNFTIGDSTLADIDIGVDVSATTSITATGDGKIGTGSECKTKLCGKLEAGDVTVSGKVYASIPSWGTWSIEWSGFHVEATDIWDDCIP